MAGILTFEQYLGGPDQVTAEQSFPSNQKTVIYNFNRDITGWSFKAEYQTLVVDTITFNRNTGQPNFAESTVLGSFAKQDISGDFVPTVINATEGTVKVNFPAQMYNGPIIPDARKNVPIVVVGITWTDAEQPPQISTHRWCFIQSYEPGVTFGDPVLATGYTSFGG